MYGNNSRNDLFEYNKGWGDVTKKENIVDYVELSHIAENGVKILSGWGLDKDGYWHNGYWFNSKTALNSNPDHFLSRWELDSERYNDMPSEVEKASDGKLQEYINNKELKGV